MKFRVVPLLVAVLLSAGLAGCDIAPEERISGAPVNDGGGNDLDPDDDTNIAGYFYLDRPVAGLSYLCSETGQLPISGETDGDGRFVCPRGTTVSFYVGYPGELKLGEVDLSIFGTDGSLEDSRNYVTVTPGTLNGTTVDSTNKRTTNTFNLLTSLEAPPSGGRDVLLISDEVDLAFAAYVNLLSLDDSPSVFAFELEAVVEEIELPVGQQLRRGGTVLDALAAAELTDASLLRARSGIYRTATSMIDSDLTGSRLFSGATTMAMSRTGHLAGLAVYTIIDQSTNPATKILNIGTLADHSAITAAGALQHGVLASSGLRFDLAGGDQLLVSGNLVNDWLFGNLLDLYPDNNSRVPPTYVIDSDHVGMFTFNDNEFSGDAYLAPRDLNTPDIDLSLLPSGFLPRTVGVIYKGYPDGDLVTDTQRTSATYLAAQTPRPMFFRMLASGDIVSDVDFDCSEVQVVGGELRDGDGSPEFYIGQVGNVFLDGAEGEETAYMTLRLAIYEPEHPDYGLLLGTPALGRDALGSVVYDVARGELRSKSCRPEDDPCPYRVEWFDDEAYLGSVLKNIVENDLGDAEADAVRRVPTYYGQVTVDNASVCSGT